MRVIAALIGLVAATAAVAQVESPGTGRTESTVNSLNRSMLDQQQNRSAIQQNQFEVNSLRNELSRPVAPPPPVVVVPGAGIR